MRFLKSILKKAFGMSFMLVLLVAGCGEKTSAKEELSQHEKSKDVSCKREKDPSIDNDKNRKEMMTLSLKKIREGNAPEHQEGLEELTCLSQYGDTESQALLGYFFMNGDRFTKKNDELALKWLQTSSDNGHPHGSVVLGFVYGDGLLGLKPSLENAKKYYERAEAQGSEAAPCILADRMILRFGKKLSEVQYLFERGKNKGNLECYAREGADHYFGQGTKVDYQRAYDLITISLSNNNKGYIYGSARYILGLMYYEGNGVDKDKDKAVFLLNEAEREGIKEAKEYLEKIK